MNSSLFFSEFTVLGHLALPSMLSISSLPFIQQGLTRYGMTAYTIVGNIGLLFTMAIFSQPGHRRNPCSLYIFSTSSCALIGLNVATIPFIRTPDRVDPLSISYIGCQLLFYFRHTINQMMRTFFVLACADRYAISSQHARIRSFSRYEVAIRVIPGVVLFWFVLGVFPTMLRTLENGKCDARPGWSAAVLSVYILIVLGIVPLLCLIGFSVLLKINLVRMRSRVHATPNTQPSLRRRDQDLLRMLLIEIAFYTCTAIPLTVNLLYRYNTQSVIRSRERQQIEGFIYYMISPFLLYGNNSVSFWIYLCASRSFRLEFKNVIMKFHAWITRREFTPNETTATTRTT